MKRVLLLLLLTLTSNVQGSDLILAEVISGLVPSPVEYALLAPTAEFLHPVLWDQKVKHEYHLVRGAGHVDPSLDSRTAEAARFLIRSYKPWDKAALRLRTAMLAIEAQKRKTDEKDHYNQK
ncbi:MAG: hypothetical protein O3A63_17765 [Proteobacteria bacterium]|nr:hypothetical protein [Pseudomonadota bacterium]